MFSYGYDIVAWIMTSDGFNLCKDFRLKFFIVLCRLPRLWPSFSSVPTEENEAKEELVAGTFGLKMTLKKLNGKNSLRSDSLPFCAF